MSGNNRTTPKLYVCNNEGTDIHVFDLPSHELVKVIDVGGQPHGLTVTADGQWAYVTVSGPDKVAAILTETDEVVWQTNVGPNPHMLTVTPDNRFVYVCIFGHFPEDIADLEKIKYIWRETDVIDVSKRKVIKTLVTGKGPHVSYAPNNDRVYMTAWFDQHVSVIDTHQNEVVDQIPLPGLVRPICITEDEKWLYSALSGLHGFVQVNLETGEQRTIKNPPYPEGKEVPEYDAATHGIAFRPGTDEFYVTSNVDDKIYVYRIPECELLGEVEVGEEPNWITFTPDGATAYVSYAADDMVGAIDCETREVAAAIPVGDAPKRLAVVADRTR